MTSEAFTNFLCEICFLLAYRFQIAGYRDVHEYRDVKQKEPVSSSRFYLLQECVLFYFLVMTLKDFFFARFETIYARKRRQKNLRK